MTRAAEAMPVGSVPMVLYPVAGLFRHPAALVFTLAAAGSGWLLWSGGLRPVVAVLAALLVVLLVWRLLHRSSFAWCVAWPLRSARRRRRVYAPQWDEVMRATGLAAKVDGEWHVPRLVKVDCTDSVDVVTVAALLGQVPEDYDAVADRLARTFGALDCRVARHTRRSDRLRLSLLVRDPLAAPVAPFRSPSASCLTGLPVALREDGQTFGLRLLGTHLLLVGATAAGKSSVVWAILHALAPAVSRGVVEVWVVDPKGGMELVSGQRLFARFCTGFTPGDATPSHEQGYADLLEDAVSVMRDRQARLRGVTRLHEPSPEEPLVVVVVDELASLTAYVTDRDAKKRIAAALSLLLSQGRAVGVSVVAALQDPRKEVLPARDLFPTRVGLRMTEPDQVDLVLGAGARLRGARCDRIPEALPGVGYVSIDGQAEPVRVRFAHLTDADIQVMVDQHAPAAATPGDMADVGVEGGVSDAA